MYVENSLQNRFVFLISLFDLSAILKIRNGEHAHYVGLVVAWNREKQMFVALGKEFDMCLATDLDASLSFLSMSGRRSRNRSPSRLPVSPMYNLLQ